MRSPHPPFTYTLMDVHGAGAQRGDPKEGDPANWPHGNGPQGDVVRIYNHVRCVRDAATVSGVGEELPGNRTGLRLESAPNPFNPVTNIVFFIPVDGPVDLSIHDLTGRHVRTLLDESMKTGEHTVLWDGRDRNARLLPSGTYFALLSDATEAIAVKMLLTK